MILADTSVWIDHFRRGLASFARQLEAGEVATHTVVLGELANKERAWWQSTTEDTRIVRIWALCPSQLLVSLRNDHPELWR